MRRRPGDGVARTPDPGEGPRPNILMYPLPTTTRFLVLIGALLTAGLFAGNWLHNVWIGAAWARTVSRCRESGFMEASSVAVFVRRAQHEACMASAEHRRALFSLGGLAVAAVGGLAVLYVAPVVLERRRRLRPAGPKLAATASRFIELAHRAGLSRPPALMIGPATQRDGFSYGAPGRYRIALPRSIAVRPHDPAFEALVSHELAHVVHGDVALAWLARSVWYSIAPLLLLPIVVDLARGDLPWVADYTWRAGLLAGTVVLSRAALLRSREHDADVRATSWGAPVEALLKTIRSPATRPARRLVANHPSTSTRIDVLHRPESAVPVTFVDGLTVTFLAALAVPLIGNVTTTLLTGTGLDLRNVVVAVVVGPLIGATLGLGLWRQALVQRVAGGRARVAPAALGVATGLVLGQTASLGLAGSGAYSMESPYNPIVPLVVGLFGAGATVLTASLGELWATAAGRLRHPALSWGAAIAVSGVLFATVLSTATTFQLVLSIPGLMDDGRATLVLPFTSVALTVSAAVLAAAVAWALYAGRPGAWTPLWLLERGTPQPWGTDRRRAPGILATTMTGVAAGLAGAVVLVGFRFIAGPASLLEREQRYYVYLCLAAAVGTVAALAVGLLYPEGGMGAGLLAGPIATVVTDVGFLVNNTALGGTLDASFVATIMRQPIALGLALQVAVAGLVLAIPFRRVAAGRPRARVSVAAAVALALLAGVGLLAARDYLAPIRSAGDSMLSLVSNEAADYRIRVAPQVTSRRTAIMAAMQAIDTDTVLKPSERAARVRTQVVRPAQTLLKDAEALTFTTPAVREVHRHCLAALRTSTTAYEDFAISFETGDPALLATAHSLQTREFQHWRDWQAGLGTL